jgi:hypothetical protein
VEGCSRGRVGYHQLQFAARRTREVRATLHRDARFSDTELRKPPRHGFAQSRVQPAIRGRASDYQDAHALSLLDHLELAYPLVARHDPELEGMNHHLSPATGRKIQHVVGATF